MKEPSLLEMVECALGRICRPGCEDDEDPLELAHLTIDSLWLAGRAQHLDICFCLVRTEITPYTEGYITALAGMLAGQCSVAVCILDVFEAPSPDRFAAVASWVGYCVVQSDIALLEALFQDLRFVLGEGCVLRHCQLHWGCYHAHIMSRTLGFMEAMRDVVQESLRCLSEVS